MIAPGGTLGVFGGGQLGRMFAMAARQLGYRVCVYTPEAGSPAGQCADKEFVGAYDDESALADFCRAVDAATFEFENVPASVSDVADRFISVRPGGHVLRVCQNRLREKGTLARAGLPVPRYAEIRSREDLARALEEIGVPAVLKTASSGYDGKGQATFRTPNEAEAAWESLKTNEAIYETLVSFEKELSVIGARGTDGTMAFFGPIENEHADHILDLSRCPARVSDAVAAEAIEITRNVLQTLDVVGLLCVELFLTTDGNLLINELAPRPHNSGHLTIEAAATSQFEQQVRAVAGLPLGSTELQKPAAMANLLGDLWATGEPNWAAALATPSVAFHLYGKEGAQPGRKMGHLTALADDVDAAARRVINARNNLRQTRFTN